MSKSQYAKLNDSFLEDCLKNHLSIDSDRGSICSGKSDLDEEYYKHQPDPIPQHILESNTVKISDKYEKNAPKESPRRNVPDNCRRIENATSSQGVSKRTSGANKFSTSKYIPVKKKKGTPSIRSKTFTNQNVLWHTKSQEENTIDWTLYYEGVTSRKTTSPAQYSSQNAQNPNTLRDSSRRTSSSSHNIKIGSHSAGETTNPFQNNDILNKPSRIYPYKSDNKVDFTAKEVNREQKNRGISGSQIADPRKSSEYSSASDVTVMTQPRRKYSQDSYRGLDQSRSSQVLQTRDIPKHVATPPTAHSISSEMPYRQIPGPGAPAYELSANIYDENRGSCCNCCVIC